MWTSLKNQFYWCVPLKKLIGNSYLKKFYNTLVTNRSDWAASIEQLFKLKVTLIKTFSLFYTIKMHGSLSSTWWRHIFCCCSKGQINQITRICSWPLSFIYSPPFTHATLFLFTPYFDCSGCGTSWTPITWWSGCCTCRRPSLSPPCSSMTRTASTWRPGR